MALLEQRSKKIFFGNLEMTRKANITGPMKVWLCNHFTVAFITWPFMIYDLPISFGEELKAVATKFLKRWLGITKSITESVLYRSKDHFGLGLIDLETHLKIMQVCRMHMLKYSQDDSSKNLYEYMRERDKPPVVTLGKFLYTNCLCWPSINWVPGCQTIGESHSGDMETLWRGG